MRLGFYTNYSPDIAKFAEQIGFRSMELSAWPHSALDADHVSDESIAAIKEDLQARDIEISGLGYYPNFLAANQAEADEYKRYFRMVLRLAHRMGVQTVSTFAGQTPGMTVEECLPRFAAVFTDFCKEAEEVGVRIAIENCPMLDHKRRTGENIAYSPEIWEAMFDAVPSSALGLEVDPSHLVFLGIDYVQAVLDFGPRIFHVHAKDLSIDERKRERLGFYGQAIGKLEGFGNGWWRFRAPGWGEIDWARFITALLDVGYQGNIDIEHEDEVFAAAALGKIGGEADIVDLLGREPNALILGYNHLAPLLPSHEGLLPG
jgi:sugar phosphate isomerase/epimerase